MEKKDRKVSNLGFYLFQIHSEKSHITSTCKEANQSDFIFVSVAIETLESWEEYAKKFVKTVGTKLSEVTGRKRSTSYLIKLISVVIQRVNAASVSGTTRLINCMKFIMFWN